MELTPSEAARLLSEAGRVLARQRKKVTVHCAVCGQATEGNRKRKYCSVACSLRAYRARNRESYNARARERRRARASGQD